MKIVITGGPGGGKTTALDLFRRELFGQVAIVPESASAIFASGICRDNQFDVLKLTQKTIFEYQKNIESIYRIQHPDKVLLCDRGTLDGLAYWPNSEKSFFEMANSTYKEELGHYDAVIFFETAAQTGGDISTNNPYRNESNEQSIELDRRLKEIWQEHPEFYLVKSESSFVSKIMKGIDVIKCVLEKNHGKK